MKKVLLVSAFTLLASTASFATDNTCASDPIHCTPPNVCNIDPTLCEPVAVNLTINKDQVDQLANLLSQHQVEYRHGTDGSIIILFDRGNPQQIQSQVKALDAAYHDQAALDIIGKNSSLRIAHNKLAGLIHAWENANVTELQRRIGEGSRLTATAPTGVTINIVDPAKSSAKK